MNGPETVIKADVLPAFSNVVANFSATRATVSAPVISLGEDVSAPVSVGGVVVSAPVQIVYEIISSSGVGMPVNVSSGEVIEETLWTETIKVDASAGGKIATIPAGSIYLVAYASPGTLRCTDSSGLDVLSDGEEVERPIVPSPSPGRVKVWGAHQIWFESGSLGTVNYIAMSDKGPIVLTDF